MGFNNLTASSNLTVSVPNNTTVYTVPNSTNVISAIMHPTTGAAGGAGYTGGVYYGNITAGGNGSSGTWTNYAYSPQTPSDTIIHGNAKITGDLIIGEIKLSERLDKIEKRLAIIRMNDSMEEKWEELRKLGEAYRKLEKELIEGEQIWDILKK